MSTTRRHVSCPGADVFAVLADGWSYAAWVVGAARVRDVDQTWPARGSAVHHSVGTWPLVLDDRTTVVDVTAPHRLRLEARAWPAGTAEVRIAIEDDATGCVVEMTERATGGPGALVPPVLQDIALHLRNTETLHRLALLAEGRAGR